MQAYDILTIADNATSGNRDKPATAIVHDSADVRVIVFRIDPGQAVALHKSTSTVMLSVLSGSGIISGPIAGTVTDRDAQVGTVVVYEPGELHGMHSVTGTFVVMATITPRPGTRPGASHA